MSESDISSYIVDILDSKSSHSDSFTDRDFKILEDIVWIIRGMPASDSQLYNEPNDTRLPYILSSDIVDRKINSEKVKYLEPAENPTIDQYIIKVNDILISIRGIAGKLVLVNKELGNVIASSQIAILRIKSEQVSPEYLYYVLSSTYAQHQLAEYKIGKNISGLSLKDLLKVHIPVPSLLDQHEIVKRIKITEMKDREPTEPIGISLEEFIKREESDTLEFKSTMRKPTRLPQSILTKEQLLQNTLGQEKKKLEDTIVNEKKLLVEALEKEILKTVAAFMNSHGGTLVIGVDDNGSVCGIEGDFETFRDRKSWDGYSQHLVNIICEHIGAEFMSFIDWARIFYKEKTIAKLTVKKSSWPVYLEYPGVQEFYIRGANTTQALSPKQQNLYIKENWKNI